MKKRDEVVAGGIRAAATEEQRQIEMTQKVNLSEKLALVGEFWSPKAVGSVNDFHVKLVKLEPKTTVNTGTAGGERTREVEWI